MRKKLLTLVVGVFMIGLVGTALAATKTIKLGGTLHAAIADINGGKATIAGYAKDRSQGQIAAVFADAGIGKNQKSKVVIYSARGSMSGTARFDSSLTAGKGSDIAIKHGVLPINKGTGAYKGAHGTIKFSGMHSKSSNTFTIKYSGSVKVKK